MGSKRTLSPFVAEQAKNERLEAEKRFYKVMAILFALIACVLALGIIGLVYISA